MSGFRSLPALKRVGGDNPWQLQEEMLYDSEIYGGLITTPVGARSDMASIPWFFRRVLPRDGDWSYPAIQHDYQCQTQPSDVSSDMSAKIFREAMLSQGVPRWKAELMYNAVRWFGPRWNNQTEADNGSN